MKSLKRLFLFFSPNRWSDYQKIRISTKQHAPWCLEITAHSSLYKQKILLHYLLQQYNFKALHLLTLANVDEQSDVILGCLTPTGSVDGGLHNHFIH